MKREPFSRRRIAGKAVFLALFAALLASAALLRFTGINWDQHQQVHPDERFIVWVADTMSLPDSLGEAFDPARSPLNPFRWPAGAGELAGKPRNYAYGHFPLYLLVIVAHAAQGIAEWFGRTTFAFPPAFQPIYTVGRHLAEYDYLALVGRAISALADLGTLLCVFWLARFVVGSGIRQETSVTPALASERSAGASVLNGSAAQGAMRQVVSEASRLSTRLFAGLVPPSVLNRQPAQSDTGGVSRGLGNAFARSSGGTMAGLLAAAMYAFAVLPIQLSHYAAVDAVLTFCVTAAVALAVRSAGPQCRRSWI